MSLKYSFVILLLSCLFTVSSCSGNKDQEAIITEDVNLSQQFTGELDENTIPREAQKEEVASVKEQSIPDSIKTPKIESLEGGVCVDDFNAGSKPNCLEGDLGAFDFQPEDLTQSCLAAYNSDVKRGDSGFSMRLEYDVDSLNPAFNGFWTKLEDFDASDFSKLVFWVKGDQEYGFTDTFKVELKNNSGETGKYYVKNITAQWKKIEVPLKDFAFISDFSDLVELVFVFEDRIASKKQGTIWVDDIYFVE